MVKNINSLFKRFRKSTDGNFAIMLAVLIGVVVFGVAVAIDSSRLVQASTKLKALTDNAALAASEGEHRTLAERKEIFEDMMQSGLAISPELSGFEYTLEFNDDGASTFLIATSRSEAQLFFPMTRGDGAFVNALTEVTTGKENIEIALVLDISSSMAGTKIAELQNSAANFVNTFMDNVGVEERLSISIVPFGGSVRLPDNLSYMLGTPPLGEDWAAHWTDGEWNSCVSTGTIDFDKGITPQDRLSYIPDFTSYARRDNWCPDEGNELVGLTRNRVGLLRRINSLTLSAGTAIDVGVAWGFTTLDDRWRGHNEQVRQVVPRNFSKRTRKIMVVMADGGITAQNFPDNAQLASENPPYHTNDRLTTEAQSKDQYEEICDLVKFRGITVYTVGFDLNGQEDIDTLQYCGTSAAHNFEADTGELNTVFETVAKAISTRRLSQ